MKLFYPPEAFFEEPIQDKAKRRSSWFIYVAAYVIRPICKLLFRYKVTGRENIPAIDEAPVIFAANHVSFADPLLLWVATYPRITRFLARSSLFNSIGGAFIARIGAIPVDPETADRKAIRRAVTSLKRGECVGIFPEGTRMNDPGKEYHPHAGVILMAQMANVRIVPVGIDGTDRIKRPGSHRLHFPRIYIRFGEAVDLEDFEDLPKAQRTRAALEKVMDRIFELRDSER